MWGHQLHGGFRGVFKLKAGCGKGAWKIMSHSCHCSETESQVLAFAAGARAALLCVCCSNETQVIACHGSLEEGIDA